MKEVVIGLVTLISTALLPVSKAAPPLLSPIPEKQEVVLAEHQMDLNTRNENPYTNEIFAYNILLALDYLPDSFALQSGEVFAFHPNVLSEFADSSLKTGWTKYTAAEGYKTIGGLPGNGVCHLATLMNWTAQDAGLEVVSKVNHNFFPVPGAPKEYGTSIRYMPDGSGNSQNQNLYIKNTFDFPVRFEFVVDEQMINLKITR